MPEIGSDNITHYADDPLGYMNKRDLTREERSKQWIVALASAGQGPTVPAKKGVEKKGETKEDKVCEEEWLKHIKV